MKIRSLMPSFDTPTKTMTDWLSVVCVCSRRAVATCFFSQDSVATHLSCGGIFNNHFTTNFPRNPSVKEFRKSVKIWQSYRYKLLSAPFFETSVYIQTHRDGRMDWRRDKDGRMDGQMDSGTKTDERMDRGWETDWQTDWQTDRQTERQTLSMKYSATARCLIFISLLFQSSR